MQHYRHACRYEIIRKGDEQAGDRKCAAAHDEELPCLFAADAEASAADKAYRSRKHAGNAHANADDAFIAHGTTRIRCHDGNSPFAEHAEDEIRRQAAAESGIGEDGRYAVAHGGEDYTEHAYQGLAFHLYAPYREIKALGRRPLFYIKP